MRENEVLTSRNIEESSHEDELSDRQRGEALGLLKSFGLLSSPSIEADNDIPLEWRSLVAAEEAASNLCWLSRDLDGGGNIGVGVSRRC